jgi:hypothetical protein
MNLKETGCGTVDWIYLTFTKFDQNKIILEKK